MTSKASTIEAYLNEVAADKKEAVLAIHNVVMKNLPKGFEACMNYGMIGYVVPHSLYPKGYHCDPKLPLPFMALAAQKNSINFYHMAIYADKELHDWFVAEHTQAIPKKMDMGKSCLRYKSIDQIPVDLIGKLVKKVTVKDWITMYENAFRNK